jgi:hypothetical protein
LPISALDKTARRPSGEICASITAYSIYLRFRQ